MKCMNMISKDLDHSEGWGVVVNCRLEPFLKFIQFGGVTCPLECFDYSRAHDIKLGVCLYSIAHHEQDPEP